MKPIVLLALLAFSSTLFAQGLEESYDAGCNCYTITNHYDNGQVSSIHIEDADRKRMGKEKVYSASGTLNYERSWENDKLHGEGTFYHPDGSVYVNEQYENGQKVGTWTFQDPQGTPIQVIEYGGNGNDGVYNYYHNGVKYFAQTLQNGQLVSSEVINQELYDTVQEQSSVTTK